MKKLFTIVTLVFLLSVALVNFSQGASYPSRPLEMIAPAGAGGGWDTLARTIDRSLEVEKLYPQPISVVNKVGGGGAVGLAYIFQKKGDDYELIVYSPPLIINTINKTFTQNYKELVPLAKLITDYQIFTVKADSPYKTFNDLLTALKKNPSALKFAGGSSPGSMDHLAMCKVANAAGINPKDLVYVAFNNAGEAITALLGGNVAFVSSGIGEMIPQLTAGTVRALTVTSATRRGGPLKDVPTTKEMGVNITYEVWRGIFGAPGMSKEAQAWWANTLKTMVGKKTWKESLEKLQWVDAYAEAKEFANFLKDDEKSYRDLMVTLGFVK